MAKAARWSANTKLRSVQFEWDDEPLTRPVRLTRPLPREGQPARISVGGGVEVECVIVRLAAGVLYVRLAQPEDAEGNRAISAA
jgi:hypothetical protein